MDRFEEQLQGIFAEVTRYPLDVLDLNANLEEDLGIDSVKRAEILAVCQERFSLPADLEVPPEDLSSIASIAAVLRSFSNGGAARPPAGRVPGAIGAAAAPSNGGNGASKRGPAVDEMVLRDVAVLHDATNGKEAAHGLPAAAAVQPSAWSRSDVELLVIDTIAEVTRYPKDILTPSANLEEDLGIDSVKRAEILTVLQERLSLPDVSPQDAVPVDTISAVVAATMQLLGSLTDDVPPAAPRIAPPPPVPTVVAEQTRQPATTLSVPVWAATSAKPFTGKVALVTGSGHGIGKTIASHLAELGATIIVNSFHSRDRGEETLAEIRRAGAQAEHIWGSVANPVQLEKIFDDIEARFGYLDFFVSNASNGMIGPLSDITETHWDRAFRTNVIALHAGAMRALPLMRRRGGGKIISLSSPGAQRYIKYFGCMGPVKAAVESLTRYLSIELAADNIQVNSVSAGPIYGELLSKYPDSARLIPHWESLSAGNRLGDEGDVAKFVAFLLSNASDKITGSVLLVDSGGSQRIDA